MHCPACKAKVQATDPECPKCRVDLRWSVRGPDGQLYGPYTVAEVQGYAALGNVVPWTWLESKYGDVIQFGDLNAGRGLPVAAGVPMAAATSSTSDWRRGARVTLAIALGVMGVIGMVVWLAIAVPTMNLSEKSAAGVGCMGDASMLADALRKYATEHDGRLPEAATWREAVKPYVPPGKCPACGEVEEVGAGYEFNPGLSGAELWSADDQPMLWDVGWTSGQPGPHNGNYTVAFTSGMVIWLPPGSSQEFGVVAPE